MTKKKTIAELEAELAAAKKALAAAKRANARSKSKAKQMGVKPPAKSSSASKSNSSQSNTQALMKNGRKMTGPLKITVKKTAGPNYSLMEDIKRSPMYGKTNRDQFARKVIDDNCSKVARTKIVPGQLVLFEYFEPKLKDQLEYYDASPCTIFFGVFNSKQGKRVLGFNIHYYPPRMRYAIMDKIFKIYRPVLSKYFTTGTTREIDAFDYSYLVASLRKENLDFGIREYIPQLIGMTWLIPPNQWQVAVFTEGWFKKETRTQIMKYWKTHTTGSGKKKP